MPSVAGPLQPHLTLTALEAQPYTEAHLAPVDTSSLAAPLRLSLLLLAPFPRHQPDLSGERVVQNLVDIRPEDSAATAPAAAPASAA